jgi:flagellar hook-length control protein FliK
MLDDGPRAPTALPPQSPPPFDDKTARAARPDSAQAPAKTTDSKAAQSGDNANSAGDAAATDSTVKAHKTASTDKANADAKSDAKNDAKIAERAAADDNSKATGDGKPTGGPVLAALAADAASNPAQTMTPAAAVATAAGETPQAAPAATQAALAAGQTAIIATDASKPNAADLAAAQADAGKPADDSKSSGKTPFELPGDGKPQPAATDADKQAIGHPHTAAETPPAIATDAQAAVPKAAADAVQQASLTSQSQEVSTASANPAAPAQQAAQAEAVSLAGVAIEIAGKALAGKNRFEIRLDPPELGRIEVRLDVDRDGNATTRLIADRAGTLDLLRRDSAGLERALQDAGLKTSDNGLQFSLRDQSMGREQSNTPTPGAAQIVVHDDALPTSDATQRNYSRLAGLRGGIDIRV